MATAKPAPEPAPDAGQLLTVLARMTAALAVRCSSGQHSATFRQIAVRELSIATDAEVDVLEAWLTAHPPGG
jgi:hypothetical protein